MPVNLTKGQKVDLTKTNPGLNNILVGLGWDTNKYDGGFDFDLDVSVFMLGESGKVENDKNFVFYNNSQDPSGSVIYSGDNRTGEGDGDDETVSIILSRIPANVSKVVFATTIHEAEERRQNFGQVGNAYIRIINTDVKEEIIHFDLDEDFSIETALVVAEIYRHGTEWKFAAIASGYSGGLAGLCNAYGV